MPADALQCKECKTRYGLEARYVCDQCFGPLEVAYSPPTSTPDELRRRRGPWAPSAGLIRCALASRGVEGLAR